MHAVDRRSQAVFMWPARAFCVARDGLGNFQIPYLFDCKPQFAFYKVFFHHFMRLIIKGGLHFLFLNLVERYR